MLQNAFDGMKNAGAASSQTAHPRPIFIAPTTNNQEDTVMNDIMQLAALCRDKTVYIQTHNFPDPDAIGSAFGLQKLLAHLGIASELCYAGRIDKLSAAKMLEAFDIEIHSYDELRGKMTESDYIICVDSQKNAGNITDFIGNEVACIDHHPVFVEAEYQYCDIRMTGACATLIAEYYAKLGLTPDRDVATALLYGLKMDTLQFSRGVTPPDIEMFGFLLPLCDQAKLTRLERNNMEFTDLKAYGAAIDSIQLYGKNGICFIPFACPDALIATISDFILFLDEVDIAVVCATRPDGIKISVRSETERVHAGQLIHGALSGVGDGGGHAGMAGGLIPSDAIPLLGNFPEDRIRTLFLEALDSCAKEICGT
ncbi:MAG: DHH family phosphoesterase [Ruminococcaceae bacterium]|nr:DHH family phosphoesterase [Oscillospiraceae bacterium]